MKTSVALRLLTPEDLPFTRLLVEQAGWNQTDDDWLNLLRSEQADCFLAQVKGVNAGTVSVLRYDNQLAWIGMLLVEKSWRGQGIGRALMTSAINAARAKGATCVGLDATPAGRPLYEKLGFTVHSELNRWEGCVPHMPEDVPLPSWQEKHDPAMAQLDQVAFGAGRLEWLRRLARISRSALLVQEGELGAFGLVRPGRRAHYLGPVVAKDSLSARRIVEDLFRPLEGERIYWDAFTSPVKSVSPEVFGLSRQRPFYRMLFGPAPDWHEDRLIAIADPAFG